MAGIGDFISAGTAALNSTANNVIGALYANNQESKSSQGARNYDLWKTLLQRTWDVVDWFRNKKESDAQWNRAVAEDWKRWNAENEYNDPNQVALRYQNAGINSQLAMQNGLGSGSSISASPNANAVPSPGAPYGGTIPGTDHSASINQLGSGLRESVANFATLMNAFSNSDLAKAESAKYGADTKLTQGLMPHLIESAKHDTRYKKHSAAMRGVESFVAQSNMELNLKRAELENDAMTEQMELYRQSAFERRMSGLLALAQTKTERNLLDFRLRQLKSEIEFIDSNTDLNKEEKKKRKAEAARQCIGVLSDALHLPKEIFDYKRFKGVNALNDKSRLHNSITNVATWLETMPSMPLLPVLKY